MVKLKAKGHELLDPGTYLLKVIEAAPINEYEPQIRLKLRVAAGERKGFTFVDYPNLGGSENGVKLGTKAFDIFQACLNRRISIDEQLDTDDLISKKFEARVLVRRSGKSNYCEHGSISPCPPEKDEPKDEPEPEDPSDLDASDSFDWGS